MLICCRDGGYVVARTDAVVLEVVCCVCGLREQVLGEGCEVSVGV